MANLGQPANHLVAADDLGQEAAQTASIGEQLQPKTSREEEEELKRSGR